MTNKIFNLEERTTSFAENVIVLAKTILQDSFNRNSISQLIRASSSIGANYCEAIEAESKKDFTHKIAIARKEAKETEFWLRLLVKSNPEIRGQLVILWKEAHELLLIFSKIYRSCKKK